MRTLADEGFDIGLHGSYQAGVRPGALAAERAALERATGFEVRTERQHLLHWDVRRTPRLQEARLQVDSSLGFSRNVGFRAGTSLPFRHFDVAARRPRELLEVPLVVQDAALLFGPWGLDLDVAGASAVVRRLFDSAVEVGCAVTLLFHPDRLVHPDWLAFYEWALDYAVAQKGWLTSLDGLAAWWRRREASLLGD